MVDDARPVLAITDRLRPDAFAPGLPVVEVEDLARTAARATARAAPALQPGDDALIVYTSGTTGRPKGAVHTHASLLAGISSLHRRMGLAAGGPPRPEPAALPRARPLRRALRHADGGRVRRGVRPLRRVGRPRCGPHQHHVLRRPDHVPPVGRVRAGSSGLGALRLCVSGSAPLAADLWHRLAADGVAVLERYGMTETLLTLSNPLDGERRPGSVGLPLPGVEAAVDDADEHGVGELHVRGASLCRGYWGRDAFAPGGVVRHGGSGVGGRRRLRDGPRASHRAHHHRRPQRLPGRGRGGAVPPPRCGGGGRRRRALGGMGRDRGRLRGG